MTAALRLVAALWLVGGTLLLRDMDLRAPSLGLVLLMATLGTLPAIVGLVAPAWWAVGSDRLPSLGLAIKAAVVASLAGLALPYIVSAVPISTTGIAFRLAQLVALALVVTED